MAVTIAELIAQKDALKARQKRRYEIETSIGPVIAQLPDAALVAEALDMTPSFSANKHLVYNCILEPNLRDAELQKAYKVFSPEDITDSLFLPGEVSRIASKLLDLSGFKGKLIAKIHDQIKN